MDFFIEQGSSDQAVQALVKNKYGERARIMSRKEVRNGGVLGLFRKTAIEVTGYYSHTPVRSSGTVKRDQEEEKKKILEMTKSDRATDIAEILEEIRSLKSAVAERGEIVGTGDTPSLKTLVGLLRENDFSVAYIDEMVGRARRELTLEELEDEETLLNHTFRWIEESISIAPWDDTKTSPRVFVLIGPTGVGKTTTIAKLSAMYGAVADPPYDVRILTIDSYRIGALQQIQKYGEIMSIPVSVVETRAEMQKQLTLSGDADFVFIDTIGKSPRDFGKLAEVHDLVGSAGGEIHLAVSATTKGADLKDIMRQFEPFGYDGIVVTKLDETGNIGNIISALHEMRKSVSFITDGQSVPQDLERARVDTLVKRIHGFPTGRDEFEVLVEGAREQTDRG